MSHFTCLAIGDVDAIMEKYNEQDKDFFEPVENEDRESIVKKYEENENDVRTRFVLDKGNDNDTLDLFYKWYTGKTPAYTDAELDYLMQKKIPCFLYKNGKVEKSYSFRNPNAKYDYYSIVGEDIWARWDIGFIMKDGTKASTGRLGDIDIDASVADRVDTIRKTYRTAMTGFDRPLEHIVWSKFIERIDNGELTLDEACALYWEQPDVKKFKQLCQEDGRDEMIFWADDFTKTEDEYVSGITLEIYCLNIMGEWMSLGDMGLFGISDDKMTRAEWKETLEKTLHETQEKYPDEEFHILDCHI